MKTHTKHLLINENFATSLNSFATTPFYNSSSLLILSNQKTYLINNKYKSLLFAKIGKLKETKKRVLSFYVESQNLLNAYNTIETQKNALKDLLKKYPSLSMNEDFKSQFDLIMSIESEKDFKDYFQKIKETLKTINKQIDFYLSESKKESPIYQTYKISLFDIENALNGVITPNAKEYLYFYLIALRKTTISKRTHTLLNMSFYFDNALISNMQLINNYQTEVIDHYKDLKSDNVEKRLNAQNYFNAYFEKDLNLFETKFLA